MKVTKILSKHNQAQYLDTKLLKIKMLMIISVNTVAITDDKSESILNSVSICPSRLKKNN